MWRAWGYTVSIVSVSFVLPKHNSLSLIMYTKRQTLSMNNVIPMLEDNDKK